MERVVVWDDSCRFCRFWIAWARRLDWLRFHRYIGSSEPAAYAGTGLTTAETAEALQLVGPGGRFSGFDAVRLILLRLPLTSLPALLLWVPPLPWLGRRLYRRVASRRQCVIPTSRP